MKKREERRKALDPERAKAYLATLDEATRKRVARAYAKSMLTGDLPTDPILKRHCVWLFLMFFSQFFTTKGELT